jgi:uncharacterized protein YjdB
MQQFNAWAFYSDGSFEDVTSMASWNSSNGDVAGVDNAGIATATAVGTTDVQATFDDVTSDPATLIVNAYMPNTLVSLEVRPDNATIQAGSSQQFTASAKYNDGTEVDVTDQASWNSGNESIATVSSGLAQGLTEGTTNITASLLSLLGESDDAVLTVTAPAPPVEEQQPGNAETVPVAAAEPTVDRIVVVPDTATLSVGGTQQFTATAYYSDGSSKDVTASWDSSKAGVCTVASGLATGVAPGACAITATYGDETGTAVLTVAAAEATLERIAVAPGTATLSVGDTQQFTATAYYSDGSSKDVTSEVVWASAKDGVATIDNAGLASGKDAGDSEITASLQQVSSDPAPLSVVPVSVSWSMIGGIIGAVLILGLLFLALMRRRTKGEGAQKA